MLNVVWGAFGQQGATIVPEIFLRGYDPVTVFFPETVGPNAAEPADDPGVLLQIEPEHPGEYRWLDSKTLQFLPTVRWPALRRFTITANGSTHTLVTLMAAPKSISPSEGSQELEPIQEILLSFANQLNVDELSAMLRFEVRQPPGVASTDDGKTPVSVQLTRPDFTVKEIERQSIRDAVQYQITFDNPIPYGRLLTMMLQLSLDDRLKGALVRHTFATQTTFRLTGIGCGGIVFPVAAKGSVYPMDQPLQGGGGDEPLFLEFSHELGTVSMASVKQLVRFEPTVKNFRFAVSGKRLNLHFSPERDQVYRLTLQETNVRDKNDRDLSTFGETGLYFYYTRATPYLRWRQSRGILERYGAQKFPMEGRGEEQVDLRIYKLDPLDRNFWPFPDKPVGVNEEARPPGPGEEPIFATNIPKQIQLLGSPIVSRLIPLPMKDRAGSLQFGLDLKTLLTKISGEDQPGTYLLGYREIGSSTQRDYARIQVTDLSFSTVEEEYAVNFVVTSLSTGAPVVGAKVLVEGRYYTDSDELWKPIISGATDSTGQYRYVHDKKIEAYLRRIVISHEADVLTINPAKPPPHFLDNHWYSARRNWLAWLRRDPRQIKDKPVQKAHIFTERPVYRPEEPVYIKGYVRLRDRGVLKYEDHRAISLVVEGPGDKEWRYAVTFTEHGSFYHKFDEKELPTGRYQATILDDGERKSLASVDFSKESYRIPRFEVQLSGPDTVPTDRAFTLTMTADYYAGGRVVGQAVHWEVTQFLHTFKTPDQYPGFLFSTDQRFSDGTPFRGIGSSKQEVTDENGSAMLELNPALDPDGRARRYVVHATVRGVDEQTVTASKRVLAAPAFILGLKLDRFLKDTLIINPEVLALDHEGKPLEGLEFYLRLKHRQWHSYLKESDFTTGKAEYVTDVVDVPLIQQTLISTAEPMGLSLPVEEAGVYVVEIAAQDRLGRRQSVSADLYVAGDTAVAWEKPQANVFETNPDKTEYNPGEVANLLLRSPFQQAHALIIVEAPKANQYHWVEIENGQGIFPLQISGDMTPRVPVHALLLRGRLKGMEMDDRSTVDAAKPIAMASTAWIQVNPRDNQLKIELDHPAINLPGASMPMTIKLSDPDGNPLDGEVTLWLVDRAVLALGREKLLDPVPSFIDEVRAHLRIRDTRNEVVGDLTVNETPGGDGTVLNYAEMVALFDKVTVRKNFQSVPYYNPLVQVVDGVVSLIIDLPDDLTDFAVRAVATDGAARFGYGKSVVSIRLPLIVQSALPRFVRPGDNFVAGGIGRVVEGEGGPGQVEVQVEGLQVDGEMRRSVDWVKDQPQQLYFPMQVETSASTDGEASQVKIQLAVKREVDGAMDAFEVTLPVKNDRERRRLETFAQFKPDETIGFPALEEDPRPETVRQSMLLTYQPALVKMLSGLDYLARYPYFCTEQRISQLIPELALKDLLDQIGRGDRAEAINLSMRESFTYLESVQHPNGLYSYWPGSDSYVSLTAYVVEFLLMAKAQGYEFDDQLLERGLDALRASLRSDYSNFIDGESYVERTEALHALAMAGDFQEAYAHDLLARALTMDLYSEAKILYAFLTRAPAETEAINRLSRDLSKSLVFALRNGEEVYQGLQYRTRSWGGLINSSEIRTLASVARSLYTASPQEPKAQLLIDELISRGDTNGWGSTNANAAALVALGEVFQLSEPLATGHQFMLQFGETSVELDTAGKMITQYETVVSNPGDVIWKSGPADILPHTRLTLDYVPVAPGDQVVGKNEGFVVERRIQIVQDEDEPPIVHPVEAGETLELEIGTIVEEHIRVVNPEGRHYVAVAAPFAAGFEPMNPNLATAPKAAKPAGTMTRAPAYSQYKDDEVIFYYDTLPKGTYDFYFRLKTSIAGNFVHPPAKAEMMYRETVRGRSDGTRIIVTPNQD
jgi:uncharacterized protein YfaS (alpha-2-macroglobulin family)